MNHELNRQMEDMINDALGYILSHYEEVWAEWSSIKDHLEEKGSQATVYFKRAMGIFSDLLDIYQEKHVDANLWERFHAKWFNEIHEQIKPNLTLYILTLMENAVFKVVHPVAVTTTQYLGVQYLFIKISEVILMEKDNPKLEEDAVFNTMVQSRQSPIRWVARVVKKECKYSVVKIYNKDQEDLTVQEEGALLHITEELIEVCGDGFEVVSYPFKNETLLLGINREEHAHLSFFIQLLTHLLESDEVHSPTGFINNWKDAVVMFTELILRSQTLHEAIQNITYGFVQFLKFERCALFAYSDKEGNGFGLSGYHVNKEEIRGIEENIGKIPLIYKSLSRLQPLGEQPYYYQPIYIDNILDTLPQEYIERFQLKSLVVAPIYVPSKQQLIGAAILDCGPDTYFDMDNETLLILKKFGRLAGELMSKFMMVRPEFFNEFENISLSTREIDVLKLLADGASTTEAAEVLKLSEYTVRDYVSNLMKRLKARNRTEAVVRAIRMGIIY